MGPQEHHFNSETDPDERKFYLGHVRVEYHLREKGVTQEVARARYYRKHPAELHDALKKEGWE